MGERNRITSERVQTKSEKRNSQRQGSALFHSNTSPIGKILFLQKTIGNQAVQRLFKFGVIQAKLKIGESNDIYEQESNNIGQSLSQIPAPRIQKTPEKEPAPPEKIEAKPQKILSEETIRTISAIALAETDPQRTAPQEVDVAWIYYNRWLADDKRGFESSSAYLNKDKEGLFMIWMSALGDDKYADVTHEQAKKIDRLNKDIAKFNSEKKTRVPLVATIADYVRHLALAKRALETQAKVEAALKEPSKNPYPGWQGQGSRDDIDRDFGHWPMVRQYIRLRNNDKKLPALVKILPAKQVKNYTILFDLSGIEAHFGKDKPKQVPKLTDDELITAAQVDQTAVKGAAPEEIRRFATSADIPQRTHVVKGSTETEMISDIETSIQRMRGLGEGLDSGMRERFETLFGADFRGVRAHAGHEADSLTHSLQARAFTVGSDIFFRGGEYNPQTAQGRELLAHELTHVVQQGYGGKGRVLHTVEDTASPFAFSLRVRDIKRSGDLQPKLAVSRPDDNYEQEADRVVDEIMSTPETQLQRQPIEVAPNEKDIGEAGRENASTSKPMSPGVSLEEVLRWADKLSGFPYAFSANDTVRSIVTNQKNLRKKIDELERKLASKKDPSKKSPEERQEWEKTEKDLTYAKKQLEDSVGSLQAAKEDYWNKTLKELVAQKVGGTSAEIMNAIQKYGIVCNTYIEVVMRMSGFADFPITDQPYLPKSEKYKAIEEERNKRLKARPGWGLEWVERMVDWALSQGEVLYDDSDPARQTLPEPEAGDIVIFRRGSSSYHVNMVVLDRDAKFNLAGASSPGIYSGKALATPFVKYSDKLQARGGSQDIPHIMGQEKYLWILRPKYRLPEPTSPETVPKIEAGERAAQRKPITNESLTHQEQRAESLLYANSMPEHYAQQKPSEDTLGGTSIDDLRSGGQPMPESVRAYFEPRFGCDFGHVKIHTDPRASEMASRAKARAFTIGWDVVFGAGQYALETDQGKRLLAHELTHVVQQAREVKPRLQRFTAELDADKVYIKPEKGDTDADLEQILCPPIKERKIARRNKIDVTACLPKGTVKALLGPYNCADFVRQSFGGTPPKDALKSDWFDPVNLWQELLKSGYQIRSFGVIKKDGTVESAKGLSWQQLRLRMGDLVFMMGGIHLKQGAKEPDQAGDKFTVNWDHVGFFIVRSRIGFDFHLAKDGDENPIGIYQTGAELAEGLPPGAYVKGIETLMAYLYRPEPEKKTGDVR